jgi:hypothetical protein
LSVIDEFSKQCKTGELERHWRWVECVLLAMTSSLEQVMAMGDMDVFEKVLRQQASLPGLQEASLTDYKGRIVNPTVPGRVRAGSDTVEYMPPMPGIRIKLIDLFDRSVPPTGTGRGWRPL